MITQWLIEALSGLLRAVLSLLPEWAADLPAAQNFGEIAGNTGRLFDAYVPMSLIVICLLVLAALRVGLSLWHFILFVWHQIPAIGGSS